MHFLPADDAWPPSFYDPYNLRGGNRAAHPFRIRIYRDMMLDSTGPKRPPHLCQNPGSTTPYTGSLVYSPARAHITYTHPYFTTRTVVCRREWGGNIADTASPELEFVWRLLLTNSPPCFYPLILCARRIPLEITPCCATCQHGALNCGHSLYSRRHAPSRPRRASGLCGSSGGEAAACARGSSRRRRCAK